MPHPTAPEAPTAVAPKPLRVVVVTGDSSFLRATLAALNDVVTMGGAQGPPKPP